MDWGIQGLVCQALASLNDGRKPLRFEQRVI